MHKTFLILSLPIFMCLSCKEKQEKIPPGIISEKEMVSILTDFHLSEATANQYNARYYSERVSTDELRLKVLSDHQQSLKDFSVSLSYYHNHGGKLEEIYRQVIDSIGAIQRTIK